MTRVSPALLRLAASRNAAACPIPEHHRTVYAILSRAKANPGSHLTDGERWFLDSVLRLQSLSERQQARLTEIACKVERGRK